MKPLFDLRDLQLIENLVLDSALEPKFNALNGSLVWDDELPENITPEGLDILQSLWYARSLFHKGLTLEDHPINPEYSKKVWEQALFEIPRRTGFQRMALSGEDRKFFEQKLNQKEYF